MEICLSCQTTLGSKKNVLEKPFSRSHQLYNPDWLLRHVHILLLACSRLTNTELCSFRSLLGRSEYKERFCDA